MSPKVSIILLSGKQGSGKTTTAHELENKLAMRANTKVVQTTFAKCIYKMHDAIRAIGDEFGIPRVEPKDGPLLQLLGTEWGRKMDPNIWVNTLKWEVETTTRNTDPGLKLFFIVSDCRFQNELAAFPGALKVRLECMESVRQTRCSMWRPNINHPSEVDLDESVLKGHFDLVIDTGHWHMEAVAAMILQQLN